MNVSHISKGVNSRYDIPNEQLEAALDELVDAAKLNEFYFNIYGSEFPGTHKVNVRKSYIRRNSQIKEEDGTFRDYMGNAYEVSIELDPSVELKSFTAASIYEAIDETLGLNLEKTEGFNHYAYQLEGLEGFTGWWEPSFYGLNDQLKNSAKPGYLMELSVEGLLVPDQHKSVIDELTKMSDKIAFSEKLDTDEKWTYAMRGVDGGSSQGYWPHIELLKVYDGEFDSSAEKTLEDFYHQFATILVENNILQSTVGSDGKYLIEEEPEINEIVLKDKPWYGADNGIHANVIIRTPNVNGQEGLLLTTRSFGYLTDARKALSDEMKAETGFGLYDMFKKPDDYPDSVTFSREIEVTGEKILNNV